MTSSRFRLGAVRLRPLVRSHVRVAGHRGQRDDKEVKVTAELPGLEEKDVSVELANGVLVIKGEKRAETEDKDRLFSERYYGRFERRIPVDDIEADNVDASFKSGVLT